MCTLSLIETTLDGLGLFIYAANVSYVIFRMLCLLSDIVEMVDTLVPIGLIMLPNHFSEPFFFIDNLLNKIGLLLFSFLIFFLHSSSYPRVGSQFC